MKQWGIFIIFLLAVSISPGWSQPTSVDLAIGESYQFDCGDGIIKTIRLLNVEEIRDPIRHAVRDSKITVEVDGVKAVLPSALYNLPRIVNHVKMDAAVTKGYVDKSSKSNVWNLSDKADVRLRLWKENQPLLQPGTFGYPIRQRLFASDTQMANDPCYVNACDNNIQKGIYYHYALDFGGYDLLTPILAATDGEILSVGNDLSPDITEKSKSIISPRYDVIYIRDCRGWHYRYSHLSAILPHVKPGDKVKKGDWIGQLGKEGASGGWSHLHFGIMDQDGGSVEAYAFMIEAYLNEHPNALLAVARPHKIALTGQSVELDASNSICDGGEITSYEWQFEDGSSSSGQKVVRVYDKPGAYSEILRIKDNRGQVDIDFAVVHVFPSDNNEGYLVPSTHVSCYPTWNIHPNDEVYFKVRTFGAKDGKETWDFGDGSKGETCSLNDYATISHHYKKPGLYIVTAKRTSEKGIVSTGRVKVIVEKK
jgi:murein DD-endopeptidase MepM/ murein hydrolase activator NlpD